MGQVRSERFVVSIYLSPLAYAFGWIIHVVADDAAMLEHDIAECPLVCPEIGLAATLNVPSNFQHERQGVSPQRP